MNEIVRKPESDPHVLQVRKIGNSLGLILPKELLARLQLQEGDKLQAVEQPEKAVKLVPYDDTHARAMQIAREVMHEYRETFRALAK